jgi:hypothetical protein
MLMNTFIHRFAWLALLASTNMQAQNFYNTWYYNYDLVWEAGVGAGMMNCLTDLGGRKGNGAKFIKDIHWASSKPGVSFYISATYKDVVAVRFSFQSGSVSAADSVLKRTAPLLQERYGRNLSFSSSIREFSLLAETHPLFWKLGANDKIPSFSPYLIAGLGYYHFNPRAVLDGRWIDLQPLRLEGQGLAGSAPSPYSLRQFCFPAGAGIRYETGPLFNLRLECLYRFLLTDYLDDVSGIYVDPGLFDLHPDPGKAALAKLLYQRMGELQPGVAPAVGAQRGNAGNNDAYFSFQLTVGYVFRRKVR